MPPDVPPPPMHRGWCPSAHAPMETGDGWIVRARVGCRRMTGSQLGVVADLAEAMGNGLIELTMRGNVQVRGVPEHRTRTAASQLVDCGLAGADEASDRRRAVVVNPLAEHGGRQAGTSVPGGATVAAVVGGLEDVVERLGGDLPAKWWAVVDPDVTWPMPVAGCDVAVRRRAGAWHVGVAGCGWVRQPDPVGAVRTLARRCARRRVRARDLDAGELADLIDPFGATEPVGVGDGRAVWWGIRQDEDGVVAALAPAFGVATPDAFRVLQAAATAEVSVHPTPQRGVVLVGAPPARRLVEEALAELGAMGWLTSADDGRRLTSACIGDRGCSASMVDTWQVASELEATVPTHVSGCDKRCGAPTGVRELVASAPGTVVWRS